MGLFDALVPGSNSPLGFALPDWAQSLATGISNSLSKPATTAFGVGTAIGTGASFPQLTSGGTPTQQGPGSGLVPANPDGSDRNYSSIRQKMIDHLGFAPRRKTVNFMLRRMGADFTEAALGIDQNDVLWLLVHKRTSSRRHYVETYMKWCRRGDGARKRLQHFASKCGAHRARGGGGRRRKQPPQLRIVKVPAK